MVAASRYDQAEAVKAESKTAYGFGSQLTAADGKKLDASYAYYLHGPLARMELGDINGKVQGVDYAYTLQGWLKGVNGQSLDASQDMGLDGNIIAKDAFAYSLGYYNGDYQPIGGCASNAFGRNYVSSTTDLTGKNLYNGNIGNATYAIQNISSGQTTGYTYGYDQLNRLKRMRQHNLGGNTGNWDALSISNSYAEDFNYDANGNILNLQRKNGTGALMDNLSYGYNYSNGNLQNNRLNSVTDAAGVVNSIDIGSSSYSYDAIGNLTSDTQAGISNIDWTVYGKIKSIAKTGGNIAYSYDAGGNRVSKTFGSITTYYVRDAQGNPLAVYEQAGTTTTWKEQQLYGSSRLGMWKPDIDLATATGNSVWGLIGTKSYELTNHLGNVLAVVSDKRVAVSGGGYEAEVLSANDYYSGGMQMPGRTWTLSDAYRYGFNGKENDNEVEGQQDYGMRIYDRRIVRFKSVDPIAISYPELTPYQFANRPIDGIDLDGLEFRKSPGMFYSHAASGKAELSKSSAVGIQLLVRLNNVPSFYTKTLGITSQKEFVKAVESTNMKLYQLNPPPTISGNKLAAKEDAASYLINTVVEQAPEVIAYNEVGTQSSQFSSALNLVGAAYKNGYIPDQFANDANFKAHITNYLFDGSLPSNGFGENFEAYKDVVSTLGKNLYNNLSGVLNGKYDPNRGTYEKINVKSGLDNFYSKPIVRQKEKSQLQKALDRYDKSSSNGRTNTTTISPAQ
ncbi:RHS repeat domain-containing protein [Pelobium manganitolerans]|uniref:RHS repeat domain-containing protein n=1 Tax=Pelobium manganitolerans TaxID=1842495 RepID=UPI003FA35FF5